MFPDILKIGGHLTIKVLKSLSYLVANLILKLNLENFKFLGERFKSDQGALVVPGAVVGNH